MNGYAWLLVSVLVSLALGCIAGWQLRGKDTHHLAAKPI